MNQIDKNTLVTALPPMDPEDGKYNGRDVLGMCRVYPFLQQSLVNVGTTEVYKADRELARIALQMTKIGMPVDLEERKRVRTVLDDLAKAAEAKLLTYTQGEHYATFLDWVARFQAKGARKADPKGGEVNSATNLAYSEEGAFLLRVDIRKAEFEVMLGKVALQEAVYQWCKYGHEQGTPYTNWTLAEGLGELAEPNKIANILRSWGSKGVLVVEKTSEGKGKEKRTVYTATIPEVPKTPEAQEAYRELIAENVKGLNMGSKVQQSAVLRTAGVPLVKTTEKTGMPKIDKEVLEELGHHEASRDMLQFILTDKAVSFIDGISVEPSPFEGYGTIRPDWSIHKITGRWGSSPNCFDGATEILTPGGWVRFDALREEMVAQYDVERDAISFVQPTRVIRQVHKGEMVRLQRRNIDLLVTPDHRLLLYKRDGSHEDVLAQDFVPDRKMRTAAHFSFEGHAQAPGLVLGPARLGAWITLLCAAQADGTWNGSGWDFKGFSKQRKIDRLVAALRVLGLDCTLREYTASHPFREGETRQRTGIYVKKCDIGDQIREMLGALKHFGSWLLQWGRPSVEFFLREIMHWDGSYTRRNCYSSSEKVNADWVQTLFVLTGRRARIRPYDGSPIQTRTNWQVDVCERQDTWTTNTIVERQLWDDTVYCVSVPSSYVMVRRGGNVMIVGQCQNWSKRAGGGVENIRKMIAAYPGYIICGGDYDQVEARLLGAQSQDPFLLEIFNSGKDIHTEFGCLAFPAIFPKLAEIYAQHQAHLKATGEVCGPDASDPKSTCDMCTRRDKLRDLTKRLEYGGLYKGEADTLWQSIVKDEPDLKRETVVQFLVEVNRACAGLRKWQDEMLLQVLKDKVIKSPILGRCQFFPMGRVDPTVAANYPNQAGGADLWSIGARKFAAQYDQYAPVEVGPRMFHNGHDSVSVLCKEERGEEVCKAIEESWGCRWNNVNFTIKATAAHRWSAT